MYQLLCRHLYHNQSKVKMATKPMNGTAKMAPITPEDVEQYRKFSLSTYYRSTGSGIENLPKFDTSDLIDAANANSIDPIEVYPEKELKYEEPKFIDDVKYNREEMVYMTGAILAGLLPTDPYVHSNGVSISSIRNAINTARMTIDMLDQVTKPNRFSSESNED